MSLNNFQLILSFGIIIFGYFEPQKITGIIRSMGKVRLVSYNLNHSLHRSQLIENIVQMSKLGTNIFCFQEMRTSKKKSFIGDEILETLGSDWQGKFLLSYNSKNDYGLGIVWNAQDINLRAFQSIDLPVLKGLPRLQSMIEQYLLSGDASPVKRAANIATFDIDGKLFRVINLHIDWHGGQKHRLSQVKHLINYLQKDVAETEIICGDFNTIGLFTNKKETESLQNLLGQDYIAAFPKFKLTTMHGQHLDHIFVRNCKVDSSEVHRMWGSDHFPVSASLDF